MKINDFPEQSLQPNLIPVQSISNDTSNSKASSTSTSSDSTQQRKLNSNLNFLKSMTIH